MKLDYILANLPIEADEIYHQGEQAHVYIRPKAFNNFVNYLNSHCEFSLLLDISIYKNSDEISFWFMSLTQHEVLGVITKKEFKYINLFELSHLYANAESLAYLYNEFVKEEFFQGIENFRKPISKYEPVKSVSLSETDHRVQDTIRVNNHMNRYGDIDLGVISENDRAIEIDYQLNGIRKFINESLTEYNSFEMINHLLKIDGFNSPSIAIGFCMTVEKLIECEIPDRAKALRMIFLEFSRILEAIEYISSTAYSIQATYLYHKTLLWLQNVERVMVYYTGNIFHLGIFSIGGVLRDVQPGWMSFCHKYLKEIQAEIKDELQVILGNSLWANRLEIGHSRPSDLIKWGICSSPLRSAGINSDLRKRHGFYFYNEVIFQVPIALKGNVYDRFILSFMEIDQSFEVIFQVLDNLPTGETMASEFSIKTRLDDQEFLNTLDLGLKDGIMFHNLETFSGYIQFTILIKDRKIVNFKINSDHLSKLNYFKELAKDERIRDLNLLFRSLNIKQDLLEI